MLVEPVLVLDGLAVGEEDDPVRDGAALASCVTIIVVWP